MPVLSRILPQILPRQLALRPGLIKRVLQQVERRDALLETAPETSIYRHVLLHPEIFRDPHRTAVIQVYLSLAAPVYPQAPKPKKPGNLRPAPSIQRSRHPKTDLDLRHSAVHKTAQHPQPSS